MALALFCSWERSFWQDTTTPVGRCVSRTAESVVFTPGRRGRGPIDVHPQLVVGDLDRLGLLHHGDDLDLGEEVWRRPWLSKGEMRTSRCVPCSIDSVPYE